METSTGTTSVRVGSSMAGEAGRPHEKYASRTGASAIRMGEIFTPGDGTAVSAEAVSGGEPKLDYALGNSVVTRIRIRLSGFSPSWFFPH